MFKKGDRVKWMSDDGEKHGTVLKSGKNISVVQDGGRHQARGPADLFDPSDKPLPALEPSLMDKYSITGMKQFLGTDGYCFSATVRENGEKIGMVHNSGSGGANDYNGLNFAGIPEFEKDSIEWSKKNGYECAREAADLFVEWYCEHRPYGVSPREYLKGFVTA
jgi:hypothetical protein